MGRLGHGDVNDQLTPKLIESLVGKHIVDIACGHCHNIALSQQVISILEYCG